MLTMQKSEHECQRLNSFLVINSKFNFERDYLSAKNNSPYFFSRDDTKIMFPALVISITGDSLTNHKNYLYNTFCHSLEIGVVDQRIDNCKPPCKPCEKRNSEQVFIDAGNILRKTINTISNYKLYKVSKDAIESLVYGQQDIMDLKLANGIYDTISIVKNESNFFNIQFKQNNESINFTDHELPTMNLLSKFAQITICDICVDNELSFSYKTYKGCC